jgi:REP-associated tyrosine transposase
LAGRDDGLVRVGPVLKRVARFADLLESDVDEAAFNALRLSEGSGRPLGNADFIAGLERILCRPIARRAPGRRAKMAAADQLD